MTLSEYLVICKTYLMPYTRSQFEFMSDFFRKITIECPEEIDEDKYYCFATKKDEDKAKRIFTGRRPLPRKDIEFMRRNFDEYGLLDLVENMGFISKQNCSDALNKYGIEISELGKTLCSLFIQILDDLYAKKCDANVSKESIASDSDASEDEYDEKVIDEARRFCIKHCKKKELFPLCQIAMYLKPMESHYAEIYNDYVMLDKRTQRAVMKLNEIPMFSFEQGWEYKYISMFDEDIKELGLVDFDVFYEGGKWFHKIIEYPDLIPYEMNPVIFPIVKSKYTFNREYGFLLTYIDEFLYYKDKPEKHKYVEIPPLNYLWEVKELASCDENEMVFWINLFVYNACFVIPREYKRKEPQSIVFHAPNIKSLTTYEDLYYAALMVLYDIYN